MTTTVKHTPFTRSDLVDALDQFLDFDYDLTDDYSGRGMYGDTCFGVTVESAGAAAAIGAALLLACHDNSQRQHMDDAMDDATALVAPLVRGMRLDSMGLGTIFYFPGWTLDDQ